MDIFFVFQKQSCCFCFVQTLQPMFPAIHGVVPLNCPKDTNTYINRVGRTARYEDGKAFLLPSENESIFILEVPPDKKDFYSYNPCQY